MDQADQTAINADVLGTLSNSMADAVERVGPSLVLVNGRQRQPASGVVYAEDMVLTADHVLEREEDLTIQTHDGRTLAAQFVGRDPSSDLAVLKVPGLGVGAATAASEPARTSSNVTAFSRREKAEYMVGRYEINSATRNRPMLASENMSTVLGKPSAVANPSVSSEDPLTLTAFSSGSTPIAQNIPV